VIATSSPTSSLLLKVRIELKKDSRSDCLERSFAKINLSDDDRTSGEVFIKALRV
jgi:hypothetical protein